MYNPVEIESYNEWIELYNDEGSDVNLEEFTLCGKALLQGYIPSGGSPTNEEGLILHAGDFAVITDGVSGTDVYTNFDVDPTALAVHVDAGSLCSGALSNSGDTIYLEKNNQSYEEVTYSEGSAEDGYSLALIDNDFVQSAELGGTPGKENEEAQSPGGGDDDNNQTEGNQNETETNSSSDDETDEIIDLSEEDDTSSNNDEDDEDDYVSLSQNSASTGSKKAKSKKVILNAPSEEVKQETQTQSGNVFISAQEMTRVWIVYGFIAFAVILALLIAFKKL